jgi:hypothetical protein
MELLLSGTIVEDAVAWNVLRRLLSRYGTSMRPCRYVSGSPLPQGLGDEVEGERWSKKKRRPAEGFAMADGGQCEGFFAAAGQLPSWPPGLLYR